MKNFFNKIYNIKDIPNQYRAFSFDYDSDIRVKGYAVIPEDFKEVIIFNRGGTGLYGALNDKSIKKFNIFAHAGFAVVASQYRDQDKMGGEDVNDVVTLSRMFDSPLMMGVSRGGMMAFRAALEVSVKAIAVVNPLVDEIHMANWRPGWSEHQIKTYGGGVDEKIKRSPARWFDMIPNIPISFFFGNQDDKVDPQPAKVMAQKMGAKIQEYQGGHHIMGNCVEDVISFFRSVI